MCGGGIVCYLRSYTPPPPPPANLAVAAHLAPKVDLKAARGRTINDMGLGKRDTRAAGCPYPGQLSQERQATPLSTSCSRALCFAAEVLWWRTAMMSSSDRLFPLPLLSTDRIVGRLWRSSPPCGALLLRRNLSISMAGFIFQRERERCGLVRERSDGLPSANMCVQSPHIHTASPLTHSPSHLCAHP